MVADLNCNSLLNLNKPIFAREISAVYLFQTNTLVALTGTTENLWWPQGWWANESDFSNGLHCHSPTLKLKDTTCSWIWAQIPFVFEALQTLFEINLKIFIFLVKRSCSVWEYSFGTSVDFEIRLFHWNWLRRLWLVLLRTRTVFLQLASLQPIPLGTKVVSLKLCQFSDFILFLWKEFSSRLAKKAFTLAPLGPSYLLRTGWY